MPQIRLLAPWTNADGENFAAGEVIEASEDEARDLNGRGHASLVEEEEKLAQQQATSGVYDARAQRPGTPQGKAQTQSAPRQPDPDPKPSGATGTDTAKPRSK